MTLSSETVLSVLVGGLLSALSTWAVAHVYFRKQDARQEQVVNALARFLENLAANRGSTLSFTRDAKGRITNASVTLTGAAIPSGSVLYAPSVAKTTEERTRTLRGQDNDLMS